MTPHLGTLGGPAGRVVVVPAGAAGSSSLTERHGSGALEQLGQQLEHQHYDHDPQHRIGPLPLRPPAPNAPTNRADPACLNEASAGINPYPASARVSKHFAPQSVCEFSFAVFLGEFLHERRDAELH